MSVFCTTFVCLHLLVPFFRFGLTENFTPGTWYLLVTAWLLFCMVLPAVLVFLIWNRKLAGKKKKITELQQDLVRLQSTLNAVPLYIFWFTRSGRITNISTLCMEGLGYSQEKLLSMHMDQLDPGLTSTVIAELFETFLQKKTIVGTGQLSRSNGKAFPVEQLSFSIAIHNKKYVVSIYRDISNRIRENRLRQKQEDELRRAKDTAEAANSMRTEFFANLNHNIRTPMNAIIGYAEMLATSDLGEREQRFAKTIIKNGGTLVSMVNDVMEFAKLEAGRVKISRCQTSLKGLLGDVTDFYVDQFLAKQIEYSITVDSDLPEIFLLDENHSRQILLNLVSNAVKFTDSGKISLAVSGTPLNDDEYSLQFSVIDTGSGIPKDILCRLTDLFSRGKERVLESDGKLMGLTLCSCLAEMMGGRCFVENNRDRGATFILSLVAPAVKISSIPVESLVSQAHLRDTSLTSFPVLLVVDDVPMITALVRDFFQHHPIEVLMAETSEKGLALARTRIPDLILMDINLDGTDGRELVQLLKQDAATVSIPIIAMTGKFIDNEHIALFDDCLMKPFSMKNLEQLVERYFGSLAEDIVDVDLPLSDSDQRVVDIHFVQKHWNSTLEKFLNKAVDSGSLSAAAVLGTQMQKYGKNNNCSQLSSLGIQLDDCATALDIVGVDRLLALLKKEVGCYDET